ncbi:hypothetical protein Purlil1_6225 [Purpureocillium lilacinum]|uniref:Uncharacterized protein n=1 Tax=Purpureocillium lilacinum TaxID=33203 RepID=A0ABR0BZQ0_PURLI|nr:hypothetical protein Purlil1_6225 [Purpureocillium lilacinum]
MSAPQRNVDASSTRRQPLNSQKDAGSDMSMMAFVQPGCPTRFTYQNDQRVKGLNAETLAKVFVPTPPWLSSPEYAPIKSDRSNPSTYIYFSLNISIYNQQITASEWAEQWFFMVGRVHPFALTWELEQRDGLESEEDSIIEYTVPAFIVRDHSYQPVLPRTLGSIHGFPSIQPIVSFTGPVLGSGHELLQKPVATALDDAQLKCCGLVQLSSFICPGNPGTTPFKGFHPFQVFVIFPIHANPWKSLCKKMSERRDSQFQPNALFSCTGKIAGLLDHCSMTRAPDLEQDYVFIVVPDTWSFPDRVKSGQASTAPLLPTTPSRSATKSSDYDEALARFTSTRKRKASPAPSTCIPPTPPASSSAHPRFLAPTRSLPSPDETPSKRPRHSPTTSTIVAACDDDEEDDGDEDGDATTYSDAAEYSDAAGGSEELSDHSQPDPDESAGDPGPVSDRAATTLSPNQGQTSPLPRPHRTRNPPRKY